MKHSYKVVLCFALACVLALAVSLISFLRESSAVAIIPFLSAVDETVVSFGVFAFLFLLLFDLLIILVEGVERRL